MEPRSSGPFGLSDNGAAFLERGAVGDFDGDGRADILLRNNSTGDDYIYFMSGLAITSEGYIRNVPLTWIVISK